MTYLCLPPSETKAVGGIYPSLADTAFSDLVFPELNPVRMELCADLAACPDLQQVLGLSDKFAAAAALTKQLLDAPRLPAALRYTGVLYSAFAAETLPSLDRVLIGSAVFGVVRASDEIPFYRASASSQIPQRGGAPLTMKKRWGKLLTNTLTDFVADDLFLDLRSGAYAQLGPVKTGWQVRVETLVGNTRKVVSHHNKHFKGQLAHALVAAGVLPQISTVAELIEIAQQLGFDLKEDEQKTGWLVLTVTPQASSQL